MRTVLVGIGGWGKNHARILSKLGVLTAVCDTDSKKAKDFGKKYSVNHYESVDKLLNLEEFDSAFVCTPTLTHFEIASKIILSKKNVFIEKPMTYRTDEGEKLLELSRKNNVVLSCGYIERFNPAVKFVKECVTSKKFGDLIMLEFHRENRMPLHIKDAGVIHDTSVHDIDTAMWLFDSPPNVVFARAGKINHEHEDFATIMLGFKNEKVAIISSNWVTPTKVRNFNAVFTDGIISGNFLTQEIKIEKKNETEIPRIENIEPLKLEIENFLASTEKKQELVVKPEQSVNVTKIAEAALLSSQKGTPIYLDLK